MKKTIVNFEIKKSKLDIVISLKIASDLEDFFQKLATIAYPDSPQQVSTRWQDLDGTGLMFWKNTSELDNKISTFNPQINAVITNNFGNGLYDGRELNIAPLRIVGASKGVKIKTTGLITYEEAQKYCELLAKWLQLFYREYINKAKVKAKITFEL